MAEQKNLFEKLDEIQSRIVDIKQSSSPDNEKIREFILKAERVFIYCGEKSEYQYDRKKVFAHRITIIFLLFVNIIIAAVPMMVFPDNIGLLCIPFITVAVFNILYIVFNIVKVVYHKADDYEIAYDKIKAPWMFYFYDDNGIICKAKMKLPFRLLKILVPYINMFAGVAGVAVMMLCMSEIGIAIPISVSMAILSILLILFDAKTMQGYMLYFRDDSNIIPYEQLSKFMKDNNLK